jgi:hypothetical protein
MLDAVHTRPDGPTAERVLVVAVDGPRPEIQELASNRWVDLLVLQHHTVGVTLTHEAWDEGKLRSKASVRHQTVDPSLLTAAAIRLVNEASPVRMQSLRCLVQQPEKAPEVVEALLGAFASYSVLVFDDVPYNGSILRLENRADRCFVPNDAALKEWDAKHTIRAEVGTPPDEGPLGCLLGTATKSEPNVRSADGTHRVLLISYFGPPTTLVSVQRLRYWHETLGAVAEERGQSVHVEWLTATVAGEDNPRLHAVPDPSDYLASKTRLQLLEMQSLKLPTIGVSWGEAVAEELRSWEQHFDTVVISIGPFGYANLGEVVKDLWGARVILDFRDPYGGDARMGFTLDRRTWVNQHERRAIRSADVVVSVNDRCLEVIGPGIEVPRAAINNGFDPAAIAAARATGTTHERDDDLIRFIYCGTIFRHLPVERVLDALSATRHRLLHVGRDQSASQALAHHVVGQRLGFVSDKVELNKILLGADAGIVRVGGEATTATTKIFDYIGCDLDVVVVTDGAPRSGAIHQMTEGLQGIYWVRNEPEALAEFFDTYRPSRSQRPQRDLFSRRAQTELLLDLIINDDGN